MPKRCRKKRLNGSATHVGAFCPIRPDVVWGPGDTNDILTELTRIGLRHDAHPSPATPLGASQQRCHLTVQQTLSFQRLGPREGSEYSLSPLEHEEPVWSP